MGAPFWGAEVLSGRGARPLFPPPRYGNGVCSKRIRPLSTEAEPRVHKWALRVRSESHSTRIRFCSKRNRFLSTEVDPRVHKWALRVQSQLPEYRFRFCSKEIEASVQKPSSAANSEVDLGRPILGSRSVVEPRRAPAFRSKSPPLGTEMESAVKEFAPQYRS